VSRVVRTSAVLFVNAVIIVTLISVVYRLTLNPIENNNNRQREAVMKAVFPQADAFSELPGETSGGIVNVFEGIVSGETAGYVIELSKEGYSGKIQMLVGISSVDEIITGMRVLRHTETPGLGALAVKEDFYGKFDNRTLIPLSVVRASPGENEIDALTGATITTKAITDAVNEAMDWYFGGAK